MRVPARVAGRAQQRTARRGSSGARHRRLTDARLPDAEHALDAGERVDADLPVLGIQAPGLGHRQVRRARSLGQLPEYVVVALGTNDISWETPQTTERRVRTLLGCLGPKRQVLWVDLDVDHSAFSDARARGSTG